jgi:hypothetical protein
LFKERDRKTESMMKWEEEMKGRGKETKKERGGGKIRGIQRQK